MPYIVMRRTQLYIDDDTWQTLRIRSQQAGTTVSELVRQAIRERYAGNSPSRRHAMLSIVGIWKDHADLPDAESYVRRLRKESRLKRTAR